MAGGVANGSAATRRSSPATVLCCVNEVAGDEAMVIAASQQRQRSRVCVRLANDGGNGQVSNRSATETSSQLHTRAPPAHMYHLAAPFLEDASPSPWQPKDYALGGVPRNSVTVGHWRLCSPRRDDCTWQLAWRRCKSGHQDDADRCSSK